MSIESMDQPIESVLTKVRQAKRRIIAGVGLHWLTITVSIALVVATIAIALLGVVPLRWQGEPIEPTRWIARWLIGSGLAAVIMAAIVTHWKSPTSIQVAMEIDRRFGLQERLSSAISLQGAASVEAVVALRSDAASRADSLAIADRFPVSLPKFGWLPLVIAPVLAALVFTIQPVSPTGPIGGTIDATEVRQVKTAAEELKKRLMQQRRQAEAKGLEEAEALFAKLETQLDKITANQDLTRKDALIQINDLKDQIQQRKDRLGSPEQMRKTLAQMKGLEGGPAEKIADQIAKGEFAKASDELKKLAEQVKDGKLSEPQKQALAKQAEQMAERLKKAVQEHEEKKQALQEQIEQAKRDGRGEEAGKLQQQLNEAEAADAQMKQMQQMAESMQQAAQAMQQGDSQAAADAMEQMADQLGEMQDAMSELEELQSAMDELSQSKQQMNCKQCNGAGCQGCQGQGQGEEGPPGEGLGRGAGKGDRPESETETNSYDSQVRGEVRRGKAIIAGTADGPNQKGITREEIKSVIEGSLREEGDPLADQVLPRDEREQTRQYFDRLRDGG